MLAARALTGGLGANPIEEVQHTTGAWSLRLLLLTLAVTPARRLLGWRRIAPLRRTLGLTGFAGFLCLLPLAVTSTARMMKRLGRRWTKLHRLAYVAAVCGVVHYLWLVKADLRPPLVYAGILALLLGYRLWFHRSTAR